MQALHGVIVPLLFDAPHFFFGQRHTAFEIGLGVGRDHAQRQQFGAERIGELERVRDGLIRQFRAIGGHEDALVHGS